MFVGEKDPLSPHLSVLTSPHKILLSSQCASLSEKRTSEKATTTKEPVSNPILGPTCRLLTRAAGKKALESDLSLHIHLQQRALRVAGKLMPRGDLPNMFPRYLSSAPGLGAQTYIRCYQYGQSLNHIQKHFILLALRKRGHLGSWKLNGLYSKVDRAVEARACGGDTR